MSEQTGIVKVDDVKELGGLLAQSGFFEDTKEAAQAVVKVLAGQELGFGPIASMTGINIIRGRVTLSANLMAAAIKRHPNYDYRVTKHNSSGCAIDFYQDGEQIGTSTFTMDDAKRAGLAGGQNWKKYPDNMLFARAISNGAKWFCPDAFSGAPVYTPDELGAEVDGETGEVIDVEVTEAPQASASKPDNGTPEEPTPTRPEPSEPPQRPDNGAEPEEKPSYTYKPTVLDALVDKRLAENRYNADAILGKLGFAQSVPEKDALAAAKLYRAFRDQDMEPDEAAEEAMQRFESGNFA